MLRRVYKQRTCPPGPSNGSHKPVGRVIRDDFQELVGVNCGNTTAAAQGGTVSEADAADDPIAGNKHLFCFLSAIYAEPRLFKLVSKAFARL